MHKQQHAQPVKRESSGSPLQHASALQNGIDLSLRVPQTGTLPAQELASQQPLKHRQTESALFFYRKPVGTAAVPEGWFDEDELD